MSCLAPPQEFTNKLFVTHPTPDEGARFLHVSIVYAGQSEFYDGTLSFRSSSINELSDLGLLGGFN
jgi:hypothetical protein